MERTEQTGTVTLYLSHGAGSGHYPVPYDATVDWFIVEPRNDPERLTQQVQRLRECGRTVIEVTVSPYCAAPNLSQPETLGTPASGAFVGEGR